MILELVDEEVLPPLGRCVAGHLVASLDFDAVPMEKGRLWLCGPCVTRLVDNLSPMKTVDPLKSRNSKRAAVGKGRNL